VKTISKILEPIALVILLIGGAGMVVSTFLGTADVVGTQFFGQPVHGALEMTESTMVVIVFGALTYAQIRRNHIRVELFYTRMGPRTQGAMDAFADIMAITFFGLLLWQASFEAMFSFQIDESTFGLIRVPLWPARFMLAAGTGLLIVQLFIDFFIDIERAFKGGTAVTAEDVIKREIADVDNYIDKDRK
jgi:TRAP-type C4-dicarboxylate transport system permease small subunit